MSKLAKGNVYGGVNPEYMRSQGFAYTRGHVTRPLYGTDEQTVPFLKSPAMIRREIVRERMEVKPDPLVRVFGKLGAFLTRRFGRHKGV